MESSRNEIVANNKHHWEASVQAVDNLSKVLKIDKNKSDSSISGRSDKVKDNH